MTSCNKVSNHEVIDSWHRCDRCAHWLCVKRFAARCRAISAASKADTPNVDWNQWGGSPQRNNTPVGHNIPTEWEHRRVRLPHRRVGSDEREEHQVGRPARLADLRQPGRRRRQGLRRHEQQRRLAQALSGRRRPGLPAGFDVKDGKFLWQHSSEKLPTGRVHDWPLQGICSAALVEGDRLWFVTSRGEVRCLDTEGFHDGENDGPFKEEDRTTRQRRSRRRLGVRHDEGAGRLAAQHGQLLAHRRRRLLFVCTSNGVDVEHNYIPAPKRPASS